MSSIRNTKTQTQQTWIYQHSLHFLSNKGTRPLWNYDLWYIESGMKNKDAHSPVIAPIASMIYKFDCCLLRQSFLLNFCFWCCWKANQDIPKRLVLGSLTVFANVYIVCVFWHLGNNNNQNESLSLSTTINSDKTIVLVGPSGVGKSTHMHIITSFFKKERRKIVA